MEGSFHTIITTKLCVEVWVRELETHFNDIGRIRYTVLHDRTRESAGYLVANGIKIAIMTHGSVLTQAKRNKSFFDFSTLVTSRGYWQAPQLIPDCFSPDSSKERRPSELISSPGTSSTGLSMRQSCCMRVIWPKSTPERSMRQLYGCPRSY